MVTLYTAGFNIKKLYFLTAQCIVSHTDLKKAVIYCPTEHSLLDFYQRWSYLRLCDVEGICDLLEYYDV